MLTVVCAKIACYKHHIEKHFYPPPNEIWWKFVDDIERFFLVKQIVCKIAFAVKEVSFSYGSEDVMIVVPLNPVASEMH